MSTSSQPGSPDEDAVQRAKHEIQGLVQEVVDLSKSEIEPSEFYAALMDKSVSALAAIGGVVWTQEEGAGLQLEYQVNLQQTGLAESETAQLQHGRLLQQIVEKGEPALIPPHSGAGGGDDGDESAAANPTDYLLIIAPIVSDRGVDGLVEIFQRSGARPSTQKGYLRFLKQICELAGEYVKTRRLRHFTHKQTLWEQLEGFTSLVHQALDSRETAYTIANEGRRLIGCDRVTVALSKGAKYQISAISGQDTFDKRSNIVRLLRNLVTAVAKTGEDLWFDGDTSRPRSSTRKGRQRLRRRIPHQTVSRAAVARSRSRRRRAGRAEEEKAREHSRCDCHRTTGRPAAARGDVAAHRSRAPT